MMDIPKEVTVVIRGEEYQALPHPNATYYLILDYLHSWTNHSYYLDKYSSRRMWSVDKKDLIIVKKIYLGGE